MRDYPAESAAGAPAPSAPQPSVVRKKMNRAEETADKSSELESDSAAKDKKTGEKGGPSLDESVRKAERLYASQDWNAAAAAYRDLLNRFPSHKDTPRWRDRMNHSLIAEQESRTIKPKAAKAKSADEALDGVKP
jgi:TolA-binding protein